MDRFLLTKVLVKQKESCGDTSRLTDYCTVGHCPSGLAKQLTQAFFTVVGDGNKLSDLVQYLKKPSMPFCFLLTPMHHVLTDAIGPFLCTANLICDG